MPTSLPVLEAARSDVRRAALLVLAFSAVLLVARMTIPPLQIEMRAASCVLANIPCELLGP